MSMISKPWGARDEGMDVILRNKQNNSSLIDKSIYGPANSQLRTSKKSFGRTSTVMAMADSSGDFSVSGGQVRVEAGFQDN